MALYIKHHIVGNDIKPQTSPGHHTELILNYKQKVLAINKLQLEAASSEDNMPYTSPITNRNPLSLTRRLQEDE